MKRIGIIDYGVGNLGSLRRALEQCAEVFVTDEPERLAEADALVLPGVGSFKAGMDGLKVRGLDEAVRAAAARGVPMLGICLGAQLLLERGHEFGEHQGLGIIKGEVTRFPERLGAKVPAIGWQEVVPSQDFHAKLLFEGLEKPSFYFVHSYVLEPADISESVARTTYGGFDYCAAVGKGNIFGTQFHPEKSGEAGLQLIGNFVRSI